jgi:uncharacterized protein YecE (DUF72 family)
MWANREWIGTYFPPETTQGRELSAYASWCTAVEGNTSFYGLPAPSTVARWAEEAPDDFRFVFKLPRTITHERRLRHCQAEVDEFVSRLSPLGVRAEQVSIQLPPSFGPSEVGVLDAFLQQLPSDHVWSVEVRDARFCDGSPDERRLNDTLAAHGAERIIIDTRAVFSGPRVTAAEHEAFERKPRLPVRPVAIGPHPVVRFIGLTEGDANPTWWSKWVPKLAQWLDEGRSPTFFVHTPDNAVAPGLARRFHAEVAALVPSLAPLPEPVRAPSQQRLI